MAWPGHAGLCAGRSGAHSRAQESDDGPRPAGPRGFAIRPRPMTEAIARALLNEDRAFAATRWNDALSSLETGVGGKAVGSRLVDSRTITIHASPSAVFDAIRRLGGTNGWY